jgi:hypothetical protein
MVKYVGFVNKLVGQMEQRPHSAACAQDSRRPSEQVNDRDTNRTKQTESPHKSGQLNTDINRMLQFSALSQSVTVKCGVGPTPDVHYPRT